MPSAFQLVVRHIRTIPSLLIVMCIIAVSAGFSPLLADRLALWTIVHDQCLANWSTRQDPAPCARLDLTAGVGNGTAILKDRSGVAQYLAIPTRRVSGIESPDVLAADAPGWFADAWDARNLMPGRLGHSITDDAVALAINSTEGRSQDQLHIHIDCLRADVKAQMAALAPLLSGTFTQKPVSVLGHDYAAMLVESPDLRGLNPFRLVAEGLPGAQADMARRDIALVHVTLPSGGAAFVLLAGHVDLPRLDFGHAEEILDHSCAGAK